MNKVTLIIVKNEEVQSTSVCEYRIKSFMSTYRQLGYSCYVYK